MRLWAKAQLGCQLADYLMVLHHDEMPETAVRHRHSGVLEGPLARRED